MGWETWDSRTWGRGDSGTRDSGTRGFGDARTRDAKTLGLGDVGRRESRDVINKQHLPDFCAEFVKYNFR